MTVNNQHSAYISTLESSPMQMSHKISGVIGPKFTKFVAVGFFINGVNVAIRVEIRLPVVK